MYKRIWYHAKRFRGAFWYGGGTLFAFVIMMSAFFPRDADTVNAFLSTITDVGFGTILGEFDANSSAWLLWVNLLIGTYLYLIVAVTTIRMGSRVLPTEDKDGMELILGAPPRSGSMSLIENWLGSFLALVAILFPAMLALMTFSIIYDASELVGRIVLVFIFFSLMGLFFITLSMLFSTLFFRRSIGLVIGFFYLIYAFIVQLSANAINSLIREYGPDMGFEVDVSKISIDTLLSPSTGFLTNEWNWSEFGLVSLLIIFMASVSFWWVQRPDYIEKVRGGKNRLSFLPTYNPQGRLASRYPLLFEQFRRDRAYVFIWLSLFVIIYPYEMALWNLVYADDPVGFGNLIASFDVPFMKAVLGGHPIPGSYTGFAVTQFYALSWLYYGLFIVIIAINIPSRDVTNETQDLTFGNPVHQNQVIIARVVAMIIQFTILMWGVFLSNVIFGALFDVDRNLTLEFLTTLVGWLFYSAMGIIFVAISMIPPINKGKRFGLWIFMFSVVALVSAGANPDFKILGYFSVLYYYNSPSIVLDLANMGTQWLAVFILWIIGLTGLYATLKRYVNFDQI